MENNSAQGDSKVYESWGQINKKLTSFMGICSCQRKLKSIINGLALIYEKGQTGEYPFDGNEWLLIALLEKHPDDIVTHGINCEYPIFREHAFWDWVLETKDNPNLSDN